MRVMATLTTLRPAITLTLIGLLFEVSLRSQGAAGPAPSRDAILAAATDIMRVARYCTMVTVGADGQPQARIVDPFAPEVDLTIWIATNPLTRKVQDIRRNPRVTLVYFNQAGSEYVTVIGTAQIETDPVHKATRWKADWAGLYKDDNRGDDYLLLRVRPSRLEVSAAGRGLNNDGKTWRPLIVDLPK
jgi:general stress protein 26